MRRMICKTFCTELSSAFAAHGLAWCSPFPSMTTAGLTSTYAKIADYMLLMGYDQHWDQSAPGSIAGEDWFEDTLDKRMQELDPDRTIVAIGGYGYDWVKGHQTQELTFEEAVLSARDSEAEIEFDPETANPHFSFIEDDGNRHDVWFLDGVTAFNEVQAGDAYRMAGYALWRLGSEDPSVWSVLGRTYGAPPPDGSREIGTSQDIDFEGDGELLRMCARSRPREREPSRSTDDTGQIVDETYKAVPTPFVIERTGATPRQARAHLRRRSRPGLDAEDPRHPEGEGRPCELLHHRRERGSQSRSRAAHPRRRPRCRQSHLYPSQSRRAARTALVTLEINATQRLFEALTGRSMRLFRAPFLGDAEPTTSDEIVPIEIAQSHGLCDRRPACRSE